MTVDGAEMNTNDNMTCEGALGVHEASAQVVWSPNSDFAAWIDFKNRSITNVWGTWEHSNRPPGGRLECKVPAPGR